MHVLSMPTERLPHCAVLSKGGSGWKVGRGVQSATCKMYENFNRWNDSLRRSQTTGLGPKWSPSEAMYGDTRWYGPLPQSATYLPSNHSSSVYLFILLFRNPASTIPRSPFSWNTRCSKAATKTRAIWCTVKDCTQWTGLNYWLRISYWQCFILSYRPSSGSIYIRFWRFLANQTKKDSVIS